MSQSEFKFVPASAKESAKLKIPNTQEGREFLEKLKSLTGGEELPFVHASTGARQGPIPAMRAVGTDAAPESGSSTYALDLRLEQEGYPP